MSSLIYKKRELDRNGVLCFSDYTQQKINKLRAEIEKQK